MLTQVIKNLRAESEALRKGHSYVRMTKLSLRTFSPINYSSDDWLFETASLSASLQPGDGTSTGLDHHKRDTLETRQVGLWPVLYKIKYEGISIELPATLPGSLGEFSELLARTLSNSPRSLLAPFKTSKT